MEIPVTQLPPGDPRLIDAIVGQLKSKGIFDKFRKECLADVDTKPAFLNLRQRVDGQVKKFLDTQTWKTDLNKNQLRDGVRKNIQESGILDTGIDAIINQVVNPKIKPLILPLVEDTVYTFLQIEKPKREIQEYDGQLQPPHHEQKPFYAQHQPLMPPPYPPYSIYQEIPPPYYGGPEPAKHHTSYAVSPRREIEESNNDESSVSADSEISMDEKPVLEEQKPSPHPPVVAASAPPSVPPQTSDILPMETDVISSGEDDILARASPESVSCMDEDQQPVEKIEMTEDNAVDSFDTARGETDAMSTAVEKMSLQEDAPKKVEDNLEAEKEVVAGSAAPLPVPPCLPLFDSRSLDSISSNTSGLSFSPPSGTKFPTSLPHAPQEEQPLIAETSSTCKSVEDLRSTQSTPLVDEKSPARQPGSASSSEENSKPWVPYTLPKDLPSAERITIASFGTSFAGPPATGEAARVVEGASPVSAEESQGSLGNTSSSVDEGVRTTTAPLKEEQEAAVKEAIPCRSDKSEGEITTSTSSSGSSSSNSSSAASSSSSSPENSSSRNSPGPRTFDKDRHKSESHHQSVKTSHQERSRDSGRDRYHHHHSQKSKDDRERRHSKEGDRRRSSSKHDDHASHRQKDKHHSRRDKDDDKDRDRHGKGHSYSSSGGTANPILSSGKTSSGGDSGSKDKKERSTDKSSDHKSHSSSHSHPRSSSHSKSHSSSHSKTHSSSLNSHSKSHSSSSKSSSKTCDKSSHLKSDSKHEGRSSSRRDEKTESSSEVLRHKDCNRSAASDPKKPKEAPKSATMARPSSEHTNKLNPKVDKKPDAKSMSKTESRLNSASTGADGHSKLPKAKKDEVAEKKVTKVSILKEDSTFGLHLSNEKRNVVLPKPNSPLTKLNEKRAPPSKPEGSRTGPLKGRQNLEGDEKAAALRDPSQTTPGAVEKKGSKSDNDRTLDGKVADKSITIPTKSSHSDVAVKVNGRRVTKKSKEIKPPLKSSTRKLDTSIGGGDKSPKTYRTRVGVRKRRTNGILVSSSSSESSSDEDESSLPVLKKVTIPLFNLTEMISQSTDVITKTNVNNSDRGSVGSVADKSPPLKRKRAKGLLSRSLVSESDDSNDSSSSLSPGEVLKDLFEDDLSEDDLSDFEGFTPSSNTPPVKPKTKKSLPSSNKVKKIVPIQSKPLKAKPMRKHPLKRLQQELVVVCDTGSDSSDMEMSVVKFCRNSSKSTTPLTPSSPVRPVIEQGDEGEEEALLAKLVKSNDFEGFTDEGFEDSFTSGADQRLRDYLSRFISVSGSPMYLDDFISLDSDEDDPYTEEADMACTVFSSRCQTSIAAASGRSVIEEIAEAETAMRLPDENVPLRQDDSECGAHALTALASEPPEVEEEEAKENASCLASDRKPEEADDLPQSPVPEVDAGSDASPSEMVPPPLSLYEMDSRMPLKKRKLSGSFSPASSPAKVQRRMAPRSVGDEGTPFVEDFISKDMVINTYSILTPEEDRSSSKDYEVDLSQRENSYSPLSPASDSSAEDVKAKLKMNSVVNKPDCEESSACPIDS